MSYVDSPIDPSNSARQCVLESEDTPDPGDIVDESNRPVTALRLPPIAAVVLGFGPERALGVASVPVFRNADPVGPTPEDPFTDPTMAEVINPPSSPTTNLLQGPWNGQLKVTGNMGIDPKFNFGSTDETETKMGWRDYLGAGMMALVMNWHWILIAFALWYLWRTKK